MSIYVTLHIITSQYHTVPCGIKRRETPIRGDVFEYIYNYRWGVHVALWAMAGSHWVSIRAVFQEWP